MIGMRRALTGVIWTALLLTSACTASGAQAGSSTPPGTATTVPMEMRPGSSNSMDEPGESASGPNAPDDASDSPSIRADDQLAPSGRMVLEKTITGRLNEKSVVASGGGLFFAQNMMYLHTINVYDRNYRLVKVIPDAVRLADFGYPRFPGTYKGAPVEAAMTPDHRFAFISNYSMYGAFPFTREGTDVCTPANKYPNSFVYRINVETLVIDQAIEVGAVPKYVAVTPNGEYLLVSNWCSYNESVIDVATGKVIRTIPLGPYPRGIAIDHRGTTAYVAMMGSNRIATIDLTTFDVGWLTSVGSAPRHLVISPDSRWLYVTVNGDGMVAKIDLTTGKKVAKVRTGRAPRSMTISPDGRYLYVVNYLANTMSKVRASDLRVVQTVRTKNHPIGITYDDATNHVWVACYTGSIMVFRDGTPKT
jgi:YVTN family beta-propeller protein